MRDYSNGGFFFIDAAPIIAAGSDGLKIDGIFEDAKRAVEAGKVVVLTGIAINDETYSGMIFLGVYVNGDNEAVQLMSVFGNTLMGIITNDNTFKISIDG